jgi:hypothetical protein
MFGEAKALNGSMAPVEQNANSTRQRAGAAAAFAAVAAENEHQQTKPVGGRTQRESPPESGGNLETNRAKTPGFNVYGGRKRRAYGRSENRHRQTGAQPAPRSLMQTATLALTVCCSADNRHPPEIWH